MAIVQDLLTVVATELHTQAGTALFRLFRVVPEGEIPLPSSQRVCDLVGMAQLLYSIAYYLPFNLKNETMVQFVYYQAVHDLHGGRYFRSDQDYYTLISLALQQQLQDFSGDNRLLLFVSWNHFIQSQEIIKLLPPHLAQPNRRMISEAEVLKVYSKLRGYSPHECVLSLLEYIQAWDDYGVTHFYGTVGIEKCVYGSNYLLKRIQIVFWVWPRRVFW